MRKDIFSGAGLGLLVGVIIGISIAELTGIILGALTSLLAAFFGLRANAEGEKGNQLVIGSFSFTCVLAIFLGLLIRTHNFLAPSLASQIKEYELASFDSAEIRKIILLKEFGIIPEGYSFSKEARQMNRNSILMADETSETYLCAATDEQSTVEQLQKAFRDSGGQYADIEAELSAAIPDKVQLRKTLLFFKQRICKKQGS